MDDTYTYDAFISYVAADQAWVRRELLLRLAAAGVRYALSDPAAAIALNRLESTETAIRSSRRLIAVLSPDYLVDGMARFENLMAQTLDLQELTLRVIPLIVTPLEPSRLPARLASLAAADLTDPEKREGRLAQLVDVLKSPLLRIDE